MQDKTTTIRSFGVCVCVCVYVRAHVCVCTPTWEIIISKEKPASVNKLFHFLKSVKEIIWSIKSASFAFIKGK